MVVFKDWLFTLFPRYYIQGDTNPVGGKGLFERYLEVFGAELDEHLTPKITDLTNLNSIASVDSKYLTYLAWMCGNPPDLFYSEARYRRFIQYFTDIIKNKGTVKGYELLFGLLGCTVVITEIPLVDSRYDVYDESTPPVVIHQYDELLKYDEECPTCSKYNLTINDPEGNCQILSTTDTSSAVYLLLQALIKFVEPINVTLETLTYNGGTPVYVADKWVLGSGVYNDGLYWNDNKYYKDEP
jgi:hypothetical protein